ncbi:hypothetical protein CLV59_105220 [Chitinophaga dinghuensis]|uniref:Uncharacterized protein n=1 Tax=Chitinophaga dinghuensis TaxID=1539050 RepID=A0A327VXP7_9BACT|nr:hypothetical protein [Chitinophaga dinghuensis]RAJ80113.1 hypothetical protein CLV59_105220 [Chitinophaga dinghuensis]
MLSSFSWASYLMVAALLIGIYYCIVIVRHYRRDIGKLSSSRKRDDNDDEPINPQLSLFDDTPEDLCQVNPADLFTPALGLAARIRETLNKAATEQYSKAGLILILRKLIAEYPVLKGTPFQVAINNVILTESKAMGAAGLDEGDVDLLW